MDTSATYTLGDQLYTHTDCRNTTKLADDANGRLTGIGYPSGTDTTRD